MYYIRTCRKGVDKMKVLLASKNINKYKALDTALDECNLMDYDIDTVNAITAVNSKPLNDEIQRNAIRNNKEARLKMGNNYDLYISVENGYELDTHGIPYIVSYSVIEDNDKNIYFGKSYSIRITKAMYTYVATGHSLKDLVIKELNTDDSIDLLYYLTNGNLTTMDMNKTAIISCLSHVLFKDKEEELDSIIKSKI